MDERKHRKGDKVSDLEGEEGKNKVIKKKKNVLLRTFLMSSLITTVVCGMVALAGVTAYHTFFYDKGQVTETALGEVPLTNQVEMEGEPIVATQEMNKTMAIFGTDQSGGLTDVIFVAHFNSETNAINIMGIPRDTKVEWREEQVNVLPKRHQWVSVGKINEMTSWGGIENIRSLTVSTIEFMLGIKIDNYIVVNLDAFRQIVDAIGGVEVDVKQRMKKDDYSQNLHIDLQPGLQILDGDKAEQFVRFRSYRNGDLGRITAQQQFLQAFAKKILSPEIITKIPKIIPILFTSIKTDISLTEIPNYYPYLTNFDINNLYFHVLPGEAGEENKLSFFFLNQEAVQNLVQILFFK